MKRNFVHVLSVLLLAILTTGLTSCGGDDDGGNVGSSGNGSVIDAQLLGTWCIYNDYGNGGVATFLEFDAMGVMTQYYYEISKEQGRLTWTSNSPKKYNYKLRNGNGIWIEKYMGDGSDLNGTYSINGSVLTISASNMSASFNQITGSRDEYLQSLQTPSVTYTYMLQADELKADNFTLFNYEYSWSEGNINHTGSITSPAMVTLAQSENISAATVTVVLKITGKANIGSLIDPAKTYQIADWQGIKLVVKASDGSVYQTEGKSNVISNSGKYMLANIDYFTNTLTFSFTGNGKINRTVAESQPALHEPEPEVTAGDAIDLGLSVKWASKNLVDSKNQPISGNSYFAWGETTGKDDYTWNTYKFYNGSTITKYFTTDKKTRLDMEDDAAHVILGGNWRMPTKSEVQELINNCTWLWTSYQGRQGYLVTGKNGNSIFIPANGHLAHNTIALYGQPVNWNTYGTYWTNEILTTTGQYAYQSGAILGFNKDEITTTSENARYGGGCIRAVLPN